MKRTEPHFGRDLRCARCRAGAANVDPEVNLVEDARPSPQAFAQVFWKCMNGHKNVTSLIPNHSIVDTRPL